MKVDSLTPFEKHLRIEIAKQAKRVKALGDNETERNLLRALVNAYDEYQKFKFKIRQQTISKHPLCSCCNVEPVKDAGEMCTQCQVAEAEYREER